MKNINKKVLIVSDHFSHGGVATVCKNIGVGLGKDKYIVNYLSIFVDDISFELPGNTSYFSLAGKPWERKIFFPLIFKLYKFIKEQKYDIVISNKDHVNFFLCIIKIFPDLKFKLFCNSHSTVSEIYKNTKRLNLKLCLIACKYLYRLSDYVANVSLESCRDSERFFKLSKVIYLPNPVFEELPQEPEISPFISNESINILACGRLVESKNYFLMINIFYEALKLRNDLQLTILGDGVLKNELMEHTCKLGISDKVHFKGAVSNVNDYMFYADFLWMTSIFEGFGMVIVESLASGTPVLSIDCPYGPKEIIGNDYGKIINSYDLNQNMKALLSFIDSPKYERDFYRDRALDFSIKKCTEEYLSYME